jgi:hypothetical protein
MREDGAMMQEEEAGRIQEGAGSRGEWGGMAITHNLFHHSDA